MGWFGGGGFGGGYEGGGWHMGVLLRGGDVPLYRDG